MHSLLVKPFHHHLTFWLVSFFTFFAKISYHFPLQDKEIRAIFLRTFTQMLQGYRSCLTVTRIHPKPIITFNKASFLSQRNYVNTDFVVRLLDCIYFNSFVQDRGIPYRTCDLFDEVRCHFLFIVIIELIHFVSVQLYSSLHKYLAEELKTPSAALGNIKALAHQIYLNENVTPSPSSNSSQQIRILEPTKGAFTRVHLTSFPVLDCDFIQELIETELIQREIPSINKNVMQVKSSFQNSRIVSMGLSVSLFNEMVGIKNVTFNSARRLEVMRKCINSIFDNKMLDARKTLNAVLRSLRNKQAKLALCEELKNHVSGSNAILEHEQFDLVVRLMNCALQDNLDVDTNEIAAAILPLATSFCRRLSTNVTQFAYTCIQDNPVWSNSQFWEQSFYLDVEKEIKKLYLTNNKNAHEEPEGSEVQISKQFSEFILEDSALEIAAKQMQSCEKMDPQVIADFIAQEIATVYSQAFHYANNIVYFKVPFDHFNKHSLSSIRTMHDDVDNQSLSNVTIQSNMMEESINDYESGFEEDGNGLANFSGSEVSNLAIKFISRFIDKVCNDTEIDDGSIKKLQGVVGSLVHIQMESLEPVWRESRHLPPLPKPKILMPHMLPGEDFVVDELRAYLINDGKDECRVGVVAGTQFLPAEGAIFLTNYRIIFKGRPIDANSSEYVIVRSFPISTLFKEKRINDVSMPSLDQYLHDGLQLTSNTFQIIKVAFDEEVGSDRIENFRKTLSREAMPPVIYEHFAFTSQLGVSQTKHLLQRKIKEKKTIQGMAKKTLMRTVERAGFKTKNYKHKNKYLHEMNGAMTLNPQMPNKYFSEDKIADEDSLSNSIDNIVSHTVITPHNLNDSRPSQNLHEMLYVKDYERLGFSTYSLLYLSSITSASKTSKSFSSNHDFRISSLNLNYSVARTYPGLIIVPYKVSDDIMKRMSRFYRFNRFPAIVWKHPRSRALIIRSSAFMSKNMMSALFKGQAGNTNPNPSSNMNIDFEQECYIKAIVSYTLSNSRQNNHRSMELENNSVYSMAMNSPDSQRRFLPSMTSNALFKPTSTNRTANTLRTSGGKSTIGATMGRQFQKWSGNMMHHHKESRKPSVSTTGTNSNKNSAIFESGEQLNDPSSLNSSSSSTSLNTGSYSAFYIICDKKEIRVVKPHDQSCQYDYIPIEIHSYRHVKASFKKVLKLCTPSESKSNDAASVLGRSTFYKDFVNTEWLKQIQTIMQVASLIIDLVDFKGASVMLSLEDGTDLVPQIISVAQLCLDPYYRTFDGFRTLIEKEWLAFGHRFTYRSNLVSSLSSGFVPMFLQFLDVVHQIHSQFPCSFEFNQYFLKFMAYHYVSCRFRTFLHDCEYERNECGWTEEDIKVNQMLKKIIAEDDDEAESSEEDVSIKNSNTSNMNNSSMKNTSTSKNTNNNTLNFTGTSFWDYCVRIWAKSPIFFNFYYVPIISIEGHWNDVAVLRPVSSIPLLKVWDYYLGEELAHGPSYDLEVVGMERHMQEESEINNQLNKGDTERILVNSIYNSVEHTLPNCFVQMLDQIKLLEAELDYVSKKWSKFWNKIEIPLSYEFENMIANQQKRMRELSSPTKAHNSCFDVVSMPTTMNNYNHLNFYSGKSFKSHNFEVFTPTPLSKCDYCSLLIGVRIGYRCSDCDVCCHENCRASLSKVCDDSKKKDNTLVAKSNLNSTNSSGEDNRMNNVVRSDSESELDLTSDAYIYDSRSTNNKSIRDNCTHKGYLHKKGVLLKSWKLRWFILDSTAHQVSLYPFQ